MRVLLDGLDDILSDPTPNNGHGKLANGRPLEFDPASLLSLPKAERDRSMIAQFDVASPLYAADLALPVQQRELTAFTALDGGPILEDYALSEDFNHD